MQVKPDLGENFAKQLIDSFLEGIDTAKIVFKEMTNDLTREPVISIVPFVGFFNEHQFAVYRKFIKLENGARTWMRYEVNYKGTILMKSQLPIHVIQYLIENKFKKIKE